MDRFVYDPAAKVLHVGDRKLPAEKNGDFTDVTVLDKYQHCPRRVRVPFENGYQLSVVWGTGTYSDNHGHGYKTKEFVEEPALVEAAVFTPGETDMLPIGPAGGECNDTVVGFLTPADVSHLADLVASLSTSDVPDVLEFAAG